ncbi:MAG: hypothetical protein HY286_19795 [Planctomycetes bacterium]|nr:hypothetical protein [Planctomycetota bacterium]
MVATSMVLTCFCYAFPILQRGIPDHSLTEPMVNQEVTRPTGGLHLLENCGQWSRGAKFAAKIGHAVTYFTERGIAIEVATKTIDGSACEPRSSIIFLAFEGGNQNITIKGVGESKAQDNFFLGANESDWHPGIPSFAGVRYNNLYNGVDLLIHSRDGLLEYDLEIAPGADVANLIIACHGAESLSLDENGNLNLHTSAGPLTQLRPTTYEFDCRGNRQPLSCEFTLLGGSRFSFKLGEHHPESQLVIDPGIVYSTYLEGSSWDDGVAAVTTDSALNCYVTGRTGAFDFPNTVGSTFQGFTDLFVTVLNASGNGLVFSTFLGGSKDEWDGGLSLDGVGNVLVNGTSRSSNYPTTVGAFDTTFNTSLSNRDTVATKLSPNGSALLYSTYLGGTGDDLAGGLASNFAGEAHVTGTTYSTDFPVTPGAADTVLNVVSGAFITKLNSAGSALLYSTFWGGNGGDQGRAIALDNTASAYVMGLAGSSGFPTTPGAWMPNYKGAGDTFVAKFSPTGAIVYSTIVGGIGQEFPYRIAINNSGLAATVGYTASADFPTSHGAYQTKLKNVADGYLTILNPTGTGIVYSTYLGANSGVVLTDVSLSDLGQATILGYTNATDYPTTPGAYSKVATPNGNNDVVITKFNSKGNKLVYSTYLGGNDADYGVGVTLDASGCVYFGGKTYSTTFPTTSMSFDPVFDGVGFASAFVTKLELPISNYGAGTSGCNGPQVLFAESPPNINNASFELRCSNAPASSLGILLISDQAIDGDPFGLGLNLLVDLTSPAFFPLDMSSDASGMGYISTGIPIDTNLIGQVFYLQALWLWSAGPCTPSPLGLSSSNRLNITLVAP